MITYPKNQHTWRRTTKRLGTAEEQHASEQLIQKLLKARRQIEVAP
jgi:hypothetical protein